MPSGVCGTPGWSSPNTKSDRGSMRWVPVEFSRIRWREWAFQGEVDGPEATLSPLSGSSAVSRDALPAELSVGASTAAFLLANLTPRPAAGGSPTSIPQRHEANLLPRRARLAPARDFLARQQAWPRAALRCAAALSGAGRSPGVLRSPSRPRWSRPHPASEKTNGSDRHLYPQ